MSRDPAEHRFTGRSDSTCRCLAEHRLAAEKERLAMDLQQPRQIRSRAEWPPRKAGLRRPTEYTQEIGGYDAEDAPSVNDQYTNEAIAQGASDGRNRG